MLADRSQSIMNIMVGTVRDPKDREPTELKLTLPKHIVNDLKDMEKNSKQSVDALATKALLMFIATHSDYLSKKNILKT